MIKRAGIVSLVAPIAFLVAGCGDSCGDIACLPAPPPLEVVVVDTVSVLTTITRLEGTDSIMVDTTVIRTAATTEAEVTLVTGTDTTYTTVGTLQRSDTIFSVSDVEQIPDGFFRIRIARGGRQYISELRQLEHVTGCCPYSIVGRFRLSLPAQ